jgi:hypothetical protein
LSLSAKVLNPKFASQRAWYSRNKERLIEYRRSYYKDNKEAIAKNHSEYRKGHVQETKEYSKEYRKANREHLNDLRRVWAHRRKDLVRARNRKYSLGITFSSDDEKNLLAQQNYSCAICQGKAKRGSFDLDHCHTTGKVRGLLCNKCNKGLGFFNDNIELFVRAIKYLEEYK